jgi:hypothetical protein
MAVRKKTNWGKVLIILAIVGTTLFFVGKKIYQQMGKPTTTTK